MKDTFGFPKTLRNYPEEPHKPNTFVGPLHHSTLRNYPEQPPKPNTFVSPLQHNKSYKSLSSYNGKKTVEQEHNVGEGDYYVLTNPSQMKSPQNRKKKTKNKSKSKQSHLSQALRQQLNKPVISYSQIGPQNILHCKSLEKLQIISNDRSEEIKALMNEKGFLMASNQDLRAKLANPTYREQDYIQKIAQRQFQIQNLKQNLRRKEQIVSEIEKDYKLQIERLKVKHREEMATLREEMNKLRLEKISESPKKYTTTYLSDNQKTQRPSATYNSYNPVIEQRPSATYNSYNPVIETTVSNASNSNLYRFNSQTQSSSSPVIVHSLNYSTNYNPSVSTNPTSKSPKRIETQSSKQSFKTYIGEDGFERRVYTLQNSESTDHAINSTTINENRNSLQNQNNAQTIKYSSPTTANQYQANPFTNDKITTYASKDIPASTNLYKYSESTYGRQGQAQKPLQQDYPQHNQNLYSKSLTFQCFNDFN